MDAEYDAGSFQQRCAVLGALIAETPGVYPMHARACVNPLRRAAVLPSSGALRLPGFPQFWGKPSLHRRDGSDHWHAVWPIL